MNKRREIKISLREYKDGLLSLSVLSLLAGVAALMVSTPVSASPTPVWEMCGVFSEQHSSYAGLIVESYYIDYETGAKYNSNNTTVVVTDIDGRADTDPHNIVQTYWTGTINLGTGDRRDRGEFAQVDSGCGYSYNKYSSYYFNGIDPDGHNVLLGYNYWNKSYGFAQTSPLVNDGNTSGGWTLDCDWIQYGGPLNTNERVFRIQGKGTPSGQRAGGSWTYGDFHAVNGRTTVMQTIYHEPPPPVPKDYSLTPSVTTNPDGAVEPSTQLIVKPVVTTAGSAKPPVTNWQISKVIVPPNVAVPSSAMNVSQPCTYYGGGGRSCSVASFASGGAGTGQTAFRTPTHQFIDRYTTVGDDLIAGTRLCYALSVQPRADTSTQWSHSALACVVISKKPKVQILGSGLWVGVPFAGSVQSANVDTGIVVKNDTTFGSWIEYGIFATGVVTGAGSGSAYAGLGLTNATVCKESQLSFTNAADSSGCKDNGTIGKYATTQFAPDVAASFPLTSTTPTIGSNDISDQAKSGLFTASGQVSLSGGTLQKSRWLVLNAPNADVTINGNITYTTDQLQTIYDIPQLIIIAKNITIAESVTQVDAWLIARGATSASDGVVSTCVFTSPDPNYVSFPAFPPFPNVSQLGLTTNICSQRLTINGPVMAQKLYLLRTAGSGINAASGDPAEVINLRPDAFLWSAARSVVSGRLQTVYTTELPPRL
jgi:hypothetical protein